MTQFSTSHIRPKDWPQTWDSGILILDLLNHDPALLDLSELPLLECLPAGIGDNAHLMPVLLNLSETPVHMQQALLAQAWQSAQRGDPPFVCARLQGPAPANEVADHLAARLTGTDHAGGRALWRFYDPRVFIHMAWLLRPAQLQALFGPCQQWGFAWAGDWYELERPSASEPTDADPRPWWPDAKQWRTVQNAVCIECALARVAFNAKPSVSQAPAVDRALRHAAETLHLSLDSDRQTYATHAVAFGRPFEDQPKLQAVWPAVASGELSLRQALAVLTRDDWKLMTIMARTAKQFTGS
ncbi:Uncharacterised protein [Ralstonia pickettii]|nr:hypothetical protein DP23_4010 [Ralstonia pickettii]QQK33884.1 hypothetical protein RP6297_00066 [Ralstonia pickettii]SUE00979.1 Uncharacterised protein [Ralstonia pickettii]